MVKEQPVVRKLPADHQVTEINFPPGLAARPQWEKRRIDVKSLIKRRPERSSAPFPSRAFVFFAFAVATRRYSGSIPPLSTEIVKNQSSVTQGVCVQTVEMSLNDLGVPYISTMRTAPVVSYTVAYFITVGDPSVSLHESTYAQGARGTVFPVFCQ